MPCRIIGYHHVNQNISKANVQAARHFYGELLGLREISTAGQDPAGDRLIWFSLGDCQLHLVKRDQPDTSSSRHFAVLVEDFDAIIDRLHRNGARLDECEPGRSWGYRPDGSKYAFCYDRDGNRIELMENPR